MIEKMLPPGSGDIGRLLTRSMTVRPGSGETDFSVTWMPARCCHSAAGTTHTLRGERHVTSLPRKGQDRRSPGRCVTRQEMSTKPWISPWPRLLQCHFEDPRRLTPRNGGTFGPRSRQRIRATRRRRHRTGSTLPFTPKTQKVEAIRADSLDATDFDSSKTDASREFYLRRTGKDRSEN